MKPNEQLAWALVAVTLLTLPKWLLAGAVFLGQGSYGLGTQTPVMMVLAGVCSLLLLDRSQPMSALFALVAAGYSDPILCGGGFECGRYQVGVFFPAVVWLIAATFPSLASKWTVRAALAVSAASLAFFLLLAAGREPWVWPPIYAEDVRVWEWITVASLAGLLLLMFRSRSSRLAKARARVIAIAFVPAFIVLLIDLLVLAAAKVWGVNPPDLLLLGFVANVALGWGIVTLTRAEFARNKEPRHAVNHQNPNRT